MMRDIDKMRQFEAQLQELIEVSAGERLLRDRLSDLRVLKAVDPHWASICNRMYRAALDAVVAGLEVAVVQGG